MFSVDFNYQIRKRGKVAGDISTCGVKKKLNVGFGPLG